MLHRLERKGDLSFRIGRSGRTQRRVYRATPNREEAFQAARQKIRELFREIAGIQAG